MIEVVDYDPQCPVAFEELARPIRPVVSDVAIAVEHVGSTSVPGLAAKPIIDIDVIVDAYVTGKTALILRVLAAAGLPAEELASIRRLSEPKGPV